MCVVRSIVDQLHAYMETDERTYHDASQLGRVVDSAGHRSVRQHGSTLTDDSVGRQ